MEPSLYEDPGQFTPMPPPPAPSRTGRADPLSCNFEDTFKQSSDPKVPDAILNCFEVTYSWVLYGFYVFLSMLIGPIFVVVSGIFISLSSFTITWLLSPIFRCSGQCFTVWERFITDLLNCCLAPYCRLVGEYCCSKMAIRYQQVPPGEIIHV